MIGRQTSGGPSPGTDPGPGRSCLSRPFQARGLRPVARCTEPDPGERSAGKGPCAHVTAAAFIVTRGPGARRAAPTPPLRVCAPGRGGAQGGPARHPARFPGDRPQAPGRLARRAGGWGGLCTWACLSPPAVAVPGCQGTVPASRWRAGPGHRAGGVGACGADAAQAGSPHWRPSLALVLKTAETRLRRLPACFVFSSLFSAPC